MNPDYRTYMGIDLSLQKNSLTCAIIDSARNIKYCSSLSLDEWHDLLNSHQDILLGVNSPLSLNLGYMSDEEYRQNLFPIPPKSRYSNLRVSEYQLTILGINSIRTPKEVGRFSSSMQKGFKFSSELGMIGFQFWPIPNAKYQMFEVNADAAFFSLLKVKPFSANSLEGRIQRQLCLQGVDVSVNDAMAFFEEITRHRLLTGKLPEDIILSPSSLNALIAAYTAWVLINRPTEYQRIGEPDEGLIYLPGSI